MFPARSTRLPLCGLYASILILFLRQGRLNLRPLVFPQDMSEQRYTCFSGRATLALHPVLWHCEKYLGGIMSGRPSAATELAIRYHRKLGHTVYEAARLAGIAASTLYRALKRDRKK